MRYVVKLQKANKLSLREAPLTYKEVSYWRNTTVSLNCELKKNLELAWLVEKYKARFLEITVIQNGRDYFTWTYSKTSIKKQ